MRARCQLSENADDIHQIYSRIEYPNWTDFLYKFAEENYSMFLAECSDYISFTLVTFLIVGLCALFVATNIYSQLGIVAPVEIP